MRKYEKPVMMVERFEASKCVADCNREWDHSVTTYDPQTIYCDIKGGEDSIFVSNCKNNVSTAGGSGYYFASANGIEYFCWYDGEVSGEPNPQGEALITALGIPGPGWHAGQYSSVTKDYFILSN